MDLKSALKRANIGPKAQEILLQQAQLLDPTIKNIDELNKNSRVLRTLACSPEYFGVGGSMSACWPKVCSKIRRACNWVLVPVTAPDVAEAAKHAGQMIAGGDPDDAEDQLALLAEKLTPPVCIQLAADEFPSRIHME